VAGGWRRLHNEELHNLYISPNIIRVIKWRKMWWAGHVAHIGEIRDVYTVLDGKPKEQRLLRKPGQRWEDNIRLCLREIGWEGVGGFMWLRIGTCSGLLWAW
jgi:hypothetical protein